jgi:hypothetical protein
VQVEGLAARIRECPMIAMWDRLVTEVSGVAGAVAQLTDVRETVQGWIRANEARAGAEAKVLVNWFAGWAMVMREAASELGWEMVAVDNRRGLGPAHRLNVQMDLLEIAPQFWRLEAASRAGVALSRMGPNWFGIPCTTTARNDATNSTRKGGKVWFNYRRTQDAHRSPQHGVGTPMGDKARETERLVSAVGMVVRSCDESWAIENPDGQMKFLLEMRARVRWLNRLDYCRLWNRSEIQLGMRWQKMCCVWTRRRDGQLWNLGKTLKCASKCSCRIGSSRKHVGQIEAMTAIMRSTGMQREELKCRYPRQLTLLWLGWVTEVEHRSMMV